LFVSWCFPLSADHESFADRESIMYQPQTSSHTERRILHHSFFSATHFAADTCHEKARILRHLPRISVDLAKNSARRAAAAIRQTSAPQVVVTAEALSQPSINSPCTCKPR